MSKAERKTTEYADYFGVSMLEAYFDLIDMGEIKESETLYKRCVSLTPKGELIKLTSVNPNG